MAQTSRLKKSQFASAHNHYEKYTACYEIFKLKRSKSSRPKTR